VSELCQMPPETPVKHRESRKAGPLASFRGHATSSACETCRPLGPGSEIGLILASEPPWSLAALCSSDVNRPEMRDDGPESPSWGQSNRRSLSEVTAHADQCHWLFAFLNNTRSVLFSPRDKTSRPSADQAKLRVTTFPVNEVSRTAGRPSIG